MNLKDRLAQNQAKINGLSQRIADINKLNPEALINERQECLQEILRLDGEGRILNEQIMEEDKLKVKE